jgi:hypothetical protein
VPELGVGVEAVEISFVVDRLDENPRIRTALV